MVSSSASANSEYCIHCDPHSFAFEYPLKNTQNFWIICDRNPITEGHILIMPKKHLSCIGEYSEDLLQEFLELYEKTSKFIKTEYGSVSTFEHGKIGQTVFHSHVHLLPYNGNPLTIVPEERNKLTEIQKIEQLVDIYRRDGKFLFFSIGNKKWIVDTALGAPRFFRDRFARALGRPERGDWKYMRDNQQIMWEAENEIKNLLNRYKKSGLPTSA